MLYSKHCIVSVVAALLMTVAVQRIGLAEDTVAEASALEDLTDEPSRADLFALVKAADEKDDPTMAGAAIKYFNLYGPFQFPNDTLFDVASAKPRKDSFFGIDISHYTDSKIPIESLSHKKVRFVYVKTSQGTKYKDPKFKFFWEKLGALTGSDRVHRGAYHFLSATGKGEDQAQTFLKVLNATGGLLATDMPPVLDLEWDKKSRNAPDRWAELSADEIVAVAKAWMEAVEKATGRKPMLYTARSWWRERIGDETKFAAFADYPIWIADYSKSSRAVEVPKVPNSNPWALWQFTESAQFAAGFEPSFDANVFKGTESEFYSVFGVTAF